MPLSRPATAEPSGDSEPTVAFPRPCPTCGGLVGSDGFCMECGQRAASLRDHYVEQPAAWVAGCCDRGVRHERNEDAIALAADPGPGSYAVLVVCDGVSTSPHADLASLAAAQAARDLLADRRLSDPGASAAERSAAVGHALQDAAQRAEDAVLAATPSAGAAPEGAGTASCTFAAAVVADDLVVVGNVGDSRVYWVPDPPATPHLLTVDDSLVQELIAAGQPRERAEEGPGAHAITRWLGADAPPVVPHLGWLPVSTPGWLVVCSDGLWNYASAPEALQHLLAALGATARGPLALAEALVRWTCQQGGKDNVAVALARLTPGGHPDQELR